jgi:hypothetical protein
LYVWKISAKVKIGSDIMDTEPETEEQEGDKEKKEEKKESISGSGGIPS